MSIRTELEEFVGITKNKKESETEYLKRLITAVDEKMTEDLFDELEEDVQDWINAAVEAVEDKLEEMPPFPDEVTAPVPPRNAVEEYDEEDEDVEEDVEEDAEEDVKPAKKAKEKVEKKKETPAKKVVEDKKKPAKKPAKKEVPAPEKKPAKKEEKKKTVSKAGDTVPSVRIVQLAVEFPQASYNELSKMLEKEDKGLSMSTIKAKAYIAREAATYLKSIGKLK